MAFRNHNPNIRAPILSNDKTWSNDVIKARPAKSEENANAAVDPELALLFQDYDQAPNHGWGSSKDKIVQREVTSRNKKADTKKKITKLPTSGRRAPATGDTGKRTAAAFGIWNDDNDDTDNNYNRPTPRANNNYSSSNNNNSSSSKGSKAKNASWKATSNLNRALLQHNENNAAPQQTTKNKDNKKSSAFNLETLSSALPINTRANALCKSTLTPHAASAFTPRGGGNSKAMNYRDATRSNLLLPQQKQRHPSTAPKQPQRTVKEQARSPSKLTDYARELLRLSESGGSGAAEQAEAMLRSMLKRYEQGLDLVRPDGSCYNHVIHAYAKAGRPEKAEVVLRLMFEDYGKGNKSAEPNVRVFTNLLHAWRKSKDPNAPENCEKLLAYMDSLSETHRLPNCKVDVFAVTVLLHCWVESGRKEAGTRAALIFRQMKARFLAGNEGLRPDCIAYSIVLNTFAQESKCDEAEDLLWEMVDDFLSGNDSATPRTRNFNTILAMFARSNQQDAPDRAEGVVSKFRELCDKGVLQNKPDPYTYSLLLKCWVTSGRAGACEQALACLYWMRDVYEETGDEAACPDIVKYTTVISFLARQGDVVRAEGLLNVMVDDYTSGNRNAQPDFKIFDTVLSACTGGTGADASRAEGLLKRMWSLFSSFDEYHLRPRLSTYRHVIVAFKKSKNPQRAEELLWEMEHRIGKSDKKLFQTVLSAWHESLAPDKQYHIQKLRAHMERFARSR